MAQELHKPKGNKQEKYESLIPQIKALVEPEKDITANMANVCAALKYSFDFFWVGFYLVKENELVLGPFQGPVACTRIQKGRGVCGSSWEKAQVLIVPDVEQFPGHIACSALSKSEIVIPLFNSSQQCVGVLDVDSDQLNAFDEIDETYLKHICTLIRL